MEKATAAAGGVTTFKTSTNFSLAIEMAGRLPSRRTLDIQGTGLIDTVSKKAQMASVSASVLAVTFPGVPASPSGAKVSVEIFIMDDWEYIKMTVPGVEPGWEKVKLPGDWSASANQLLEQLALLKTTTAVEMLPGENVDGVACYVVKVTPDIPALFNLFVAKALAQTFAPSGPGQNDALTKINFAKSAKSVSLKYWVDKDSFMFQKVDAAITLEGNPEDFDDSPGTFDKMNQQWKLGIKFSDYNKPVNVKLPAEALQAK